MLSSLIGWMFSLIRFCLSMKIMDDDNAEIQKVENG